MRKAVLSAAILAVSSTAAGAGASLAITLGIDGAAVTTVAYQCGSDASVRVQYVSSETDLLALVPVDGDRRVFAGVVAASGARYVSGQYEWWTKGGAATLTDLIEGETVLECEADDG